MKRYIQTLIIGVLSIALSSGCSSNLLETVPNDRISNEIFWKDANDAQMAANAVYNYLDQVSDYFSWDGITDIGHTNVPFNQYAIIEIGQHDALNNTILDFWNYSYKGIHAANFYLDNVGKIQSADPAKINILTAEVKALRAYYYIKMLVLFGDLPLVTKDLTLQEARQVSRTPATAVADFIITELQQAADVLPIKQSDIGRMTKGAALGLLARAYLYQGKFDLSAQTAKKVMDLNTYELHPSYATLFSYAGENSKEIIFAKQFIKDVYRNNIFAYMGPYSQRASNSQFVPTKTLVDSYQMTNGKNINESGSSYDPTNPFKNRDPRLKYSIYVIGDILPDGKLYNPTPGSGTNDAIDFTYLTTSTGFNLKKYIDPLDLPQPANGGLNLILLRYAEVLLTYAEAKIEANQLDQSVVDAINKVRQRADVNMPAVALSDQVSMRAMVRQERKVELAFEGLRYFDLIRWKIADQVLNGKVYGMTYKDNSGATITVEIPSFSKVFRKDRDYLWPIPQKERELNTNLTNNPNW